MTKLRILQLCNRIPYPPKDGGAIAILNMATGFVKQGCHLKMLALNTNKHYVDLKKLPDEISKGFNLEAVRINTDIKPLKALGNVLFSRESYNIRRFYSKEFEERLESIFKKEEFDIIQLEGLHISIYLDTIRKYSKAKISLRAHNVEHKIWERMAANEGKGPKNWYLNLLAQRMKRYELGILNKLDFIIPITREDGDIFNEMGCRIPMHVSATGLEVKKYKVSTSQPERNSFFHIGALDWLPNQQAMQWFLAEIWPVVYLKHPKAKFYIAGRNLPQWITDLEMPGVSIIGEVASAADFINSKEIMVVPLLAGSGMRIKIIEGMALGKAIISTGIGAEGIDYTDHEDIMIADSAESFAKAMAEILNEPSLAGKLGRNARRLAEKNYDNDRLIKSLIDFYAGKLSPKNTN